jgi:apolipoprotein N-acyltransferase
MPDGLRSYDKRRMIPGFEAHFDPGTSDLIFEHGGRRFGVAICKDMDFPDLARRYAGVAMLLVPAWDFTEDAWLHSRMAVLRGVENGYIVVRSARNGALTVSDARGAVLAEGRSGAMRSVRTEQTVLGPGPTLYSRTGDAFGWGMLALSAFLMVWTLWVRIRAGQGGSDAH